MLIFGSNSEPLVIDNIHDPILTTHLWVLDLKQMDFMLSPIAMLEEVVCSSLQVEIAGFRFILPTSWHILIYDQETTQLDIVQLAAAPGRQFTAFTYGPKATRPAPETITVTQYLLEHTNVSPMLNKHQLLCHPISPQMWVCIGPSDVFSKYLKNAIVGDLIL